MPETVLKLAEFGAIGVAMAMIGLFAFLLPKFLKIIGNHINHNTAALTKLNDVVDDLNGTVERFDQTINKFIDKI